MAILAGVNTLFGRGGGWHDRHALHVVVLGNAKKPDPSMSVNGVLAGLVAVTAPCAFIVPWAAVVIGLIAGILVCLATIVLERLQIDDPVGAVPVHMVNGMWGVISVGLFAAGNPDTAAWNGIDKAVTGLFYGGGFGQLGAQLLEAGAIFIFAAGLSWLFFVVLNRFGLLRSEPSRPRSWGWTSRKWVLAAIGKVRTQHSHSARNPPQFAFAR